MTLKKGLKTKQTNKKNKQNKNMVANNINIFPDEEKNTKRQYECKRYKNLPEVKTQRLLEKIKKKIIIFFSFLTIRVVGNTYLKYNT